MYLFLAHLTEPDLLDRVNEFLALLVELNNNTASESVSLNAPFRSQKVCISSAYIQNKLLYTNYRYYEFLARLTELCSLDRADRFSALLEG